MLQSRRYHPLDGAATILATASAPASRVHHRVARSNDTGRSVCSELSCRRQARAPRVVGASYERRQDCPHPWMSPRCRTRFTGRSLYLVMHLPDDATSLRCRMSSLCWLQVSPRRNGSTCHVGVVVATPVREIFSSSRRSRHIICPWRFPFVKPESLCRS